MLFNATQAEELRVAIVDGQNLMNLDIETLGKEQRKGSIYKGVITRIEPSLEACFVDYGTDRHGFLPFKEISRSYFQGYEGGRVRIQDVISEGVEVIVQVEKDERGNKGAALTTFVSLAGRYLVLMPNNPRGGGVSRRIEGEERQELKNAMAQLDVPKGMSLIARTAGIGRSAQDLEWDLSYLLQLWNAVETAADNRSAPFLILQESALVIRAIRDYFKNDIGEILIDTQEVHDEVYQFMSYVMPNQVSRIKRYEDHIPLFSRFQIEHQIESAFSREVSLPSGGAIVIDHTEALVSIDVNSARSTRGADIEETALRTNLEAADEIARQLRLRDLGGLVVIDFIDMENAKNQREVEQTLKEALKYDRARVQMSKLSRFGLLELSRQRLQPSLGESSHISCPRCHGTGFIRGIESSALYILRTIQEEAMKDNTGEVRAQVPVDVATFLLNEKRSELFSLEDRLDVSILLIPNIHMETPSYKIERIRTDDVEENPESSYKTVDVPEEDAVAKMIERSVTKTVRPEPAVKGIRHTQRVEEEVVKPSLFKRFTGWLKGLFAADEPVVQEAPKQEVQPAAQNNRSQQNNRKRPQNANRNTRQRNQQNQANGNERKEKELTSQASASDTRDSKEGNQNRRQNSRQNQGQKQQQPQQQDNNGKQNSNQVANAGNSNNSDKRTRRQPRQNVAKEVNAPEVNQNQVEEKVVAQVAEQVVENREEAPQVDEAVKTNRRRRNTRRDRNDRKTPQNEGQQKSVEKTDNKADEPLVINLGEANDNAAPKQARHSSNHNKKGNQRRFRQRRIPRADDIIARIDIHVVAQLAREAANVALGRVNPVLEVNVAAIQTGNNAEEVEVIVDKEVVNLSVAAETTIADSQQSAVSSEKEMPKLDLGDLVLVETRAELLVDVIETPTIAANVLRRNEYLASLPNDEADKIVELQQVETIKLN